MTESAEQDVGAAEPLRKAFTSEAGDSGVGLEVSPQSDGAFTRHGSTAYSFEASNSPGNSSPFRRFAAFFGLVEDDDVINMNKTITYNAVVGKVGFSYSLSSLLPSPRWLHFIKRRRRSRGSSGTSTNLLSLPSREANEEEHPERHFTRNPIIDFSTDIEEAPEDENRDEQPVSFCKPLSWGRASCLCKASENAPNGKCRKHGRYSVHFEDDRVEATPLRPRCAIWNGHFVDASDEVDHGFPTTLSRSEANSCGGSHIYETFTSGPYPDVHQYSTLNISADVVHLEDEHTFVSLESTDENDNFMANVSKGSSLTIHDNQGGHHLASYDRIKARKWRNKSEPILRSEEPDEQCTTRLMSPKLPAEDNRVFGRSISYDNLADRESFGRIESGRKRFRKGRRNISRASLPILGTTSLKLLPSVCDTPRSNEESTGGSGNSHDLCKRRESLDTEDFVTTDDDVELGRSHVAVADSDLPHDPIADGQQSKGEVDSEHMDHALTQEIKREDDIEADERTVCYTYSRPVNVVNPMTHSSYKSESYREALVLENDSLCEEEDRGEEFLEEQSETDDNASASIKACERPSKLSNVSVIHDSTVSSLVNETNSGKKLHSSRKYDTPDSSRCAHSTPMPKEGRASRMALRFSPIQETEASDYRIVGSSDGSDVKRRNNAFDVFRKHSGSSINFDIGPEHEDESSSSNWSRVPYITYFMLCVHVLVFAVYICNSTVDHIGVYPIVLSNNATTTLAGINTTRVLGRANPWIGPNLKFLIGIGAFYGPCIREDRKIKQIAKQSFISPNDVLGCCEVKNRGIAAMATHEQCIKHGFGHGIEWTKEVQCSSLRLQVKNSVILRPCCVGLMGKCLMLAKVDCERLDGIFHETGPEHCSQVNCLGDICQFGENSSKAYTPLNPDQTWRLFVSPFYHYGALHLAMTLGGYIAIGKQLERSMGHLRMLMIYLGTAWIALMTGCVFLPYNTHIGGTGSVFGLFGVLQIQLQQTWKTHIKPCSELSLLFTFFAAYMFFGLLPMVDNYEHIGGYLAGILLGCCLLPYVTFGSWKIKVRRFVFVSSFSILILGILFLVFFAFDDPEFLVFSEDLVYFSCLPFSSNYCQNLYA